MLTHVLTFQFIKDNVRPIQQKDLSESSFVFILGCDVIGVTWQRKVFFDLLICKYTITFCYQLQTPHCENLKECL
jgi:hypothetical protein